MYDIDEHVCRCADVMCMLRRPMIINIRYPDTSQFAGKPWGITRFLFDGQLSNKQDIAFILIVFCRVMCEL